MNIMAMTPKKGLTASPPTKAHFAMLSRLYLATTGVPESVGIARFWRFFFLGRLCGSRTFPSVASFHRLFVLSGCSTIINEEKATEITKVFLEARESLHVLDTKNSNQIFFVTKLHFFGYMGESKN